jgi:hypothetical protein
MARGADLARQAVRRTEAKILPAKRTSGAWVGTVASIVSGKLKLKRGTSTVVSEAAYARVVGFRVEADDRVVVLPTGEDGTGTVVLGQLDDGTIVKVWLDKDLEVVGDLHVAGVLTADQALFAENLGHEIGQEFQNAADPDGSTTDTVNYDDALDLSITLGPGTYKVVALFSLMAIHSASGTVHLRANIDGNAGQVRGVSVSSTVYGTLMVAQNVNVAGNRAITILGQYKCSTAGTTTAKAPFLMAWAERVA